MCREAERDREGETFSVRSTASAAFKLWLATQAKDKKKYEKADKKTQHSNKQKWAKLTVERVDASRSSIVREKKVNVTVGEYLAFPNIVLREGGWELRENIVVAMNYCRRGVCLGSPFIRYDGDWRQRWQFLHFTGGTREEIERCWEIQKTEVSPNLQDLSPTINFFALHLYQLLLN